MNLLLTAIHRKNGIELRNDLGLLIYTLRLIVGKWRVCCGDNEKPLFNHVEGWITSQAAHLYGEALYRDRISRLFAPLKSYN